MEFQSNHVAQVVQGADLEGCICEILAKAKSLPGSSTATVPRLTASRSQIMDLVAILTLFEEATNSLQGDGITISLVIPALTRIDSVLVSIQIQFPALKQQLCRALYNRFLEIICKEEFVLATILDCR